MDTLLGAWQKANDDMARLFAEKRIILTPSTRLKAQQIMHDLALTAFRVGHDAGSALRAQQIVDICGAALREETTRQREEAGVKVEGE